MPQPLSQRTADFTDSIIRRMTRVSMKYNAVNLSQGFPDFDPPRAILDRLAQVAYEGPHQYSVTWGAQNFREALAKKDVVQLELQTPPPVRYISLVKDKSRPLSDDALKDALRAKGFPIARRTVAKYREQLGIPIARLRK